MSTKPRLQSHDAAVVEAQKHVELYQLGDVELHQLGDVELHQLGDVELHQLGDVDRACRLACMADKHAARAGIFRQHLAAIGGDR